MADWSIIEAEMGVMFDRDKEAGPRLESLPDRFSPSSYVLNL